MFHELQKIDAFEKLINLAGYRSMVCHLYYIFEFSLRLNSYQYYHDNPMHVQGGNIRSCHHYCYPTQMEKNLFASCMVLDTILGPTPIKYTQHSCYQLYQ